MIETLPDEVLFESFAGFVPSQHESLREAAKEDLRQMGKQGILAAMREAGHVRFRPVLTQLRVPTLVLCGSEDTANLEAAKELASAIPHAQLAIVAGAGHAWNLERPEDFADTVRDFVQRVEGQHARTRSDDR